MRQALLSLFLCSTFALLFAINNRDRDGLFQDSSPLADELNDKNSQFSNQDVNKDLIGSSSLTQDQHTFCTLEECDEPYVFFYGEDADYGGRTLLSHDGFLFIGGNRGDQALLAKMTPSGEVIWTLVMQPFLDLPNFVVDLKIDSDNNLIGVGSARIGATIESFAFKLDPENGLIIWTQVYENLSTAYFDVSDIFEPSPGGDYRILGSVWNQSPDTGCDASFYSIDRNTGQITDIRMNYTLGSCESIWSTVENNGTFYITGRFNFSNSGSTRMRPAIMSLNETGTPLWSRLYLVGVNTDARLYSSDISFDGPSNLVMTAHGDDDGDESLTTNDIWIVRTNLAGGAQWAIKYTLPEPVGSKEIVPVGNGYVVLAQATQTSTMYLLRVNGQGDLFWAKQLNNLENRRETGDDLIVEGDFIYMVATHIGADNNHLALLRIDFETGQLVDDCYESVDFETTPLFITSPYDGFNSITPFSTTPTGTGPITVVPDDLTPLPISCAPACGLEICDNGIDDDGDGLVDCEDPDVADDCCCYEPPVLELGDDIVLCENEAIELDAGPEFETYSWSDMSVEQTTTSTLPGIYSVTVTDQCGNEQVDSLEIRIDPAPSIDLGPDVTLCLGETLTLAVDGFTTYEWFPTDGFDCSDCPTVTYNAAENNTIIVIGTTEIGCVSTDTLMVSFSDEQAGTFTATDLCAGETLTFGDLLITEAGLYFDTTTVGDCTAIDTLEVTILSTFETSEVASICAGETLTIFGSQDVTEAGTYTMDFTASNGCDSTHTIVLTVRETFSTSETVEICTGSTTDVFGVEVGEAGDYEMTFTAENGCDSTHTITVVVLDELNTEEQITICAGESVDIFGTSTDVAGEYSMTLMAENGCDSTHTITLSVLDAFATMESLSICAGETIDIFGNPVDAAGDYSMTFTAANGCDSTHTITLSVLEAFATSETIGICPGDSAEVFGESIDEAGEYVMTFTAENGCDSTHTITVVALEAFSTNEILPDQCFGSSVEIFGDNVTESGTYTQTFTAANGCDSTHTVEVTFLPLNETSEEIFLCDGESVDVFGEMEDEPGMYTESFVGANGCDSTHTITLITEEFTGSANIFPPCPGDPDSWIVYIRTVGNGGPYTVSWNGNVVVSNTINGVPVGDHVAVVTSANGCVYTVEFTVRPYNQPWWGLVSGPSCDDPQSGSIEVQTEPTDEVLSFSLDGENFDPSTSFDGLLEGTYVLYVKYGDRCVVTDTLTVPGPEDFSLVLPEDQVIDWGGSLPINPITDATPGATYKWYPSETLDCSDCEKVIASPTETTRYFLQITDANGCTEIDEILVTVDQRVPYFVPNVFSPNGDGQNDYFTVYGDDRIEEVERMIIFDRWGGQVFARTNFAPSREQLGWDGRNAKQEVSPGVFVYYVDIRLATGELVTVKGDVLIMK